MGEVPGDDILDSLPYYDNDLEVHPILKQKVEQELAREAKATQGIHPLVLPEVTLFSVSLIHSFHQNGR